jgi:guanine deaminase
LPLLNPQSAIANPHFLTPGEIADVHVPVAAIGYAHGFFLLFIGHFIQVNGGGHDVDDDIAGNQRDNARARFRAAKEFKLHGVHGKNVAGDAGDALFAGIHDAKEMAVRVLVEMPPMDDVYFFAFLENHQTIVIAGGRISTTELAKRKACQITASSHNRRLMKKKFMQEAIRISVQMMRRGKGGPFGAVVVRNGRIVGKGWNQVTSGNDPTAHAEVSAIRDACRKLKTFQLDDCELYTSCEPCPMCLSAMYWARLKKVYYANTRKDAAAIEFDDDFIYREVALPIAKRALPMKQFMRKEALAAFVEWKNKADKVLY